MAASHLLRWDANGKMFSTPDRDNDIAPFNCAASNSCGWWFGLCSVSTVNLEASIWTTGATPVYDVQASRMLVRLDT